MKKPWFIWKNQTSDSMGLWIIQMPDIIRPEERTQKITVPGRHGKLTLLEGEEVYESYTRTITVQIPCERYSERLTDWLQGESDLIVCDEEQMVYRARIAAQVAFSWINKRMLQAKIPFDCYPLKRSRYSESHIFTATDGMILRNPGNIASSPKISITGTGALSILISADGDTSNQMAFEHLPGDLEIDCDAGILITTAKSYNGNAYYYAGDYCIYQGGASGTYEYGLYRFLTEGIGSSTEWEWISAYTGSEYQYPWPGKWTGDYLRIPRGSSELLINGSAAITIDPRWRWK